MSSRRTLEGAPETAGAARSRTYAAPSSPIPSMLLTLSEAYRASLEAATLLTLTPLMEALPTGDRHPVLVLPGFMASDQSTSVLRRRLGRLGYPAHPWTFGRNLGPRGDLVERMIRRTRELADVHGRKISLVGQSLGGVYAREIARHAPDVIRQVISLGSPFGAVDDGGTNPGVSRLFEASTGKTREELLEENLFSDMRSPPPVPSTSIFSRTDGIAHWRVCIEQDCPTTDNVEIMGSHCGMGFNPVVMWIVADRLAQPEDYWSRFSREGMRRFLVPEPIFAAAEGSAPTADQGPLSLAGG